ncbi:MAG: hypothetical protein ACRBF0_08775 [Calditrichia bacterium]
MKTNIRNVKCGLLLTTSTITPPKRIALFLLMWLVVTVSPGLFAQPTIQYGTNHIYLSPFDASLGLGTSVPQALLHVQTPNATSAIIIAGDSPTGEDGVASELLFGNAIGTNNVNIRAAIKAIQGTWDADSRDLAFYVGANNSTLPPTEAMRIVKEGNVGIGLATPAYKLDVDGTVRATEVRVESSGADFVFEENYELMPLDEVESHIKEKKHLPGVSPAAEMQQNGVGVSEMQTLLLQKVEELTLYMIQLEKKNADLQEQILELRSK